MQSLEIDNSKGCASNELNQNLIGFQMALFCHKHLCAKHSDI
jgi:hypothetical protein